MTLDDFRRTIAFFGGLGLVIAGIVDDCPRIGAIAVGLLLMGVFTVPEALGVIRGKDVSEPKRKEKDDE